MDKVLNEFVDGLKKPFQSGAALDENKGNAVASYALLLGIWALFK